MFKWSWKSLRLAWLRRGIADDRQRALNYVKASFAARGWQYHSQSSQPWDSLTFDKDGARCVIWCVKQFYRPVPDEITLLAKRRASGLQTVAIVVLGVPEPWLVAVGRERGLVVVGIDDMDEVDWIRIKSTVSIAGDKPAR